MPRPTHLKRAIFESGRTQRAVAAELGLREDQFSRIVNGLRCDEVTQQKIADALGREVADLFPAAGGISPVEREAA